MSTLVMKFGGSSVGTTTALSQVLSIVLQEKENWSQLVLVASALEGVTDALIEAAHLAHLGNQRGYRRIVANLRTRHLALIEELPFGATERTALQADIDRLLFDMLDIYQSMSQSKAARAAVDASIGVGEKLSTRIIAALLRQNGLRSVAIDTTSLIVTDDVHGDATPNIPLTRAKIAQNLLPLLERGIIPVVTGFIGATAAGEPTTLGRGGSDYTASVLGVCVNATEIWMWTDVDGIMTADPRDVEGARVIADLSYDEVAELAYFGARVLHARMIGPLRQQQIPLRVKNVFKPQQIGTLIAEKETSRARTLKAVTSISGLGISAEQGLLRAPVNQLIGEALHAAGQMQADVMIASQSAAHSFTCLLIPTSAGPDAIHTTRQALEDHLVATPSNWRIQPITIITVISNQLQAWPQAAAQVLLMLGDIRVLALALGTSNCSLSLVIEMRDAEEGLARIHRHIISSG